MQLCIQFDKLFLNSLSPLRQHFLFYKKNLLWNFCQKIKAHQFHLFMIRIEKVEPWLNIILEKEISRHFFLHFRACHIVRNYILELFFFSWLQNFLKTFMFKKKKKLLTILSSYECKYFMNENFSKCLYFIQSVKVEVKYVL